MIIQERLMMAQVSIASARSAPSSVKVIDYAEPPAKPDWPNSKLLCLSAVGLGLFGGIGLAMVLDMLLPRVTASKLRLRAGEFPIFATINGRDRGAALDLRLSSVHNLPLPS
jgi:capsular polysaccharide biosynthesis protein